HGGFLELRRVHLVRYLEHFFFPSFRSSLYATCWKAKFQGKLISYLAHRGSQATKRERLAAYDAEREEQINIQAEAILRAKQLQGARRNDER
ncbi:hypothetical protein, partial [Burkholderia multivorans]|uniref:hypothetical protein n=1 Tax=Burkholderia multivorans TaxID=87883 RepID=UPI001C2433DF